LFLIKKNVGTKSSQTPSPLSAGNIIWRESHKSGICGVFNPLTGQVVWRESYKSGVAGAITVFPHQMMPDLLAGMSYSSSSFCYVDDN
jgi:hypothetical protein